MAADAPLASQAGLEILKRGGNVVDAAVAAAFALAVARPASSGLGGGGFMMIWNARRRRAMAIDYRERACLAASPGMYHDPADPARVLPGASRLGHKAVATPGQVAGLCLALEEFGSLDLPAVLEPALRLCDEGVPVDEHDRVVQREVLADFDKHPEYRGQFSPLLELYLNGGRPWDPGQRFHSPLGPVLKLIARKGAAGFYRGQVGKALVQEMKAHGGLMTARDLEMMRPTLREPLEGKAPGRIILVMPPPSSGGVATLQTLKTLAAAEMRLAPRARLDQQDPLYWHLLMESMKHAFAARAALLGDADFAEVDLPPLLSTDFARALARRIDALRVFGTAWYGRFALPQDEGTTHISIIDAEGNAVACTETINTRFGSYVVEPETGVVLNNQMDDFTAQPGVPNAFGLIQSRANAIEPLKRPLSSMSPTIVVQDDRAEFCLGGSGGPRIISATLQVLLGMLRFGLSPRRSVESPRLHHQWTPDRLEVETGFPEPIVEYLARLGHAVAPALDHAAVQAASRDRRGLYGASDPRKFGRPAGF